MRVTIQIRHSNRSVSRTTNNAAISTVLYAGRKWYGSTGSVTDDNFKLQSPLSGAAIGRPARRTDSRGSRE